MSVRPTDALGKWAMSMLPYKSHRIITAWYVDVSTIGRSYCGLTTIYLFAEELTDDPPENACKACLKTSAEPTMGTDQR